jgi:hypothetical protein
MNPGAGDSNGAAADGPEMEQPIRILMEQERETSPDFIRRVRSMIHRRTATSQFVSYSWHLPKVVLTEMVGLLGHLFSVHLGKKESKR